MPTSGPELRSEPRNEVNGSVTAPKPPAATQATLCWYQPEDGGMYQWYPPPAPGTHESDLDFDCPFTERSASAYRAHHAEYMIGFRWTRETKGTP